MFGIALAEFAVHETSPRLREEIARNRGKDVRDGIAAARRLLAARAFEHPILTLDEYEAGRITI